MQIVQVILVIYLNEINVMFNYTYSIFNTQYFDQLKFDFIYVLTNITIFKQILKMSTNQKQKIKKKKIEEIMN